MKIIAVLLFAGLVWAIAQLWKSRTVRLTRDQRLLEDLALCCRLIGAEVVPHASHALDMAREGMGLTLAVQMVASAIVRSGRQCAAHQMPTSGRIDCMLYDGHGKDHRGHFEAPACAWMGEGGLGHRYTLEKLTRMPGPVARSLFPLGMPATLWEISRHRA